MQNAPRSVSHLSPLAIADRGFIFHAERGMLPATLSGKTYIPCLILILLLTHEAYVIVEINLYIQSTALFWSLWALPELLAVFLFAIPGLVPEKKGFLTPRAHGQASYG